MCFYRSWGKMEASNRMVWQQRLLFYNHTMKEQSEKENQEKAMGALWILWGIKPQSLTRAANPPWSFPMWQSASSNALHTFSTSVSNQGTKHDKNNCLCISISVSYKVRSPNKQQNKKAEVNNCFLPPKLFFFNVSDNFSEDKLIFQYMKLSSFCNFRSDMNKSLMTKRASLHREATWFRM